MWRMLRSGPDFDNRYLMHLIVPAA